MEESTPADGAENADAYSTRASIPSPKSSLPFTFNPDEWDSTG